MNMIFYENRTFPLTVLKEKRVFRLQINIYFDLIFFPGYVFSTFD